MTGIALDRFALVAAVNHIVAETEENWLDAATLLVKYAQSIPENESGSVLKSYVTGVDKSSQAQGYSPGIGNVNVKEERQSVETVELGENFARVGHYKIFRYAHVSTNMIGIRHYLDDGVSGFPKNEWPQWLIVYENDLRPHTLAYGAYRVVPSGIPPMSEVVLWAMTIWAALKASWKWKNLQPIVQIARRKNTYTRYRQLIVERIVYSTRYATSEP